MEQETVESGSVVARVVSNGDSDGRGDGAGHGAPPGVPGALGMPIAICGMGLRLPGGIRNDTDLYRFLVEKRDARTTVPKSRYDIDAFHNAHGKPGTVASRHGYFLQDVDLAKADVSMFSMTAAELSRVDPSQRLLLEVVREAFETAGVADFRGKDIGTYASVWSEDWRDLQDRDLHDSGPYQLTGKTDYMLGNRISYEYDLKGPSVTLKTACSSAGLALHQALQSIRLGETSSAIVAGANLIFAPGLGITMSATLALSPDGSSKTFDASADGYARAEGVSCIYIKRLDEAIRDGNPVRAVIRASASNADGRTAGLTVPNPAAHEALIRQAHRNAGLDLGRTAMVECHGTGTAAGDTVEASAIARCFGRDGVYIGSVKPNLGHSEGASALSSILKAVVALEHQTIIPNIKLDVPNPDIDWNAAKLTVPTESLPWPQGRSERIGVNSFGFGGSNVHFILDSARSFGIPSPQEIQASDAPTAAVKTLLLFSANSPESLKAAINGVGQYLQEFPDRLESLAYTLAERRERLTMRAFSPTDGSPPFRLVNPIRNTGHGANQVAFVFTGQGAQWVRMGRGLMQECPAFSHSIRRMDAALQSLEHAPAWTIEGILSTCEDAAVLGRAEVAQPVCTALQVALVDLLAVWGVTPAVVVGHSSGEIAAAYAAGALSLRESAIVAFYRGFVCNETRRPGGMAAVGLGREDVQPYLVSGVQIACENSGSSVTLSGEVEALEASMAAVRGDYPETPVRRLDVEIAYHSHQMRMVGNVYHDLVSRHVEPRAPRVPFISSVRARVLSEAADFGPGYWQDNMEMPVLFHSAAQRMLHDYPDASSHVEVGPHSVLAGPLRQIYAEKAASAHCMYLSCLSRGKGDVGSFLETMGQLYCAGVNIRPPFSSQARVLAQLPTYPWHYTESYWSETRVMSSWRFRKHATHELLGSRILETSDVRPSWRNVVRVADVSWLRDHCVGSDIVFPAAAYVAMAGEAASQLRHGNGAEAGYAVREVHFTAAMLLRDDRSTEVITALRPRMLTVKEDSTWFEFSVTSHDGSVWTQHCRGLVTGSCAAHLQPGFEAQTFTRKVSPDRWYKALARDGLNYGPRFRGLQEMTAAVSDNVASAKVVDEQHDSESRYPMHPTTMDAIFQSWTVAMSNGVPRRLGPLLLPTYIEQLSVEVGATSATMDLITTADDSQASSRGGVGERIVFHLQGLRGTPLGESNVGKSGEIAAQYLQWKPDIDFADATTLMRPGSHAGKSRFEFAERLFVLCATEAKQRLAGVSPAELHFSRFLSWLDKQVDQFQEPGYPLVEDSVNLVGLCSEERVDMMLDCLEKAQSVDSRALATAIWRAYSQLADIIEGRTEYLSLLLEDNLLQQVYDWIGGLMDLSGYFSLLGNSHPQLKIIEIGAGTGGLTSATLQSLRSEFGECLFLRYVFTDVSSGFFAQARERFKEYHGIEYKELDISRDPGEQGFELGEYDLVLASNVLHATPILTETLRNCRKLLQPHGRLFLQELTPVAKSLNFVMGLFSGWWLGEEDGRADEPYIAPEQWHVKLGEAGFAGVGSVSLDGEAPYHVNANMIARPAVEMTGPKALTLLTHSEGPGPLAQATQRLLESQGCSVSHCTWTGQMPPRDRDVVSFLDVEGSTKPLLQDVGADDWDRFLKLIDTLSQSAILWLMKPAQINCQDPHHGQILGAARTIRTELAVDMATLELEHAGDEAAPAILGVVRKLQGSRQRAVAHRGDLDADMEYAWTGGAVHVSRFHWFPLAGALADASPPIEAKRLVVGRRGTLESLHWRSQGLETLEPDQVRVRTTMVGMNFRELVLALGIVVEPTGEADGSVDAMGVEATGYVVETGAAVQDVRVGDRVMTLGARRPGFATQIQLHSDNCVKIPPGLGDEEAATMPAAYATALHCLVDRAGMKRGQSLLIHSAAGGVGIAAIHVARWLGADIYATAGTDAKVEFLVRELGLAREHIFSSRDTGFADAVMRATGRVGVDVVVNSLAGELLHASWRCVAPNGVFVEIGRRDVLGYGQLAMTGFQHNRSFACVDMGRLILHPPTASRLLRHMVRLYEKGHISPIRPISVFEARNVDDAYRFMQQGQHVGKIVIKFPRQLDALPPAPPSVPEPCFRGDASYLLVGGTGGLGQAVASWMVSHGARSLIFLSPSAGRSPAHQDLLAELAEAGCAVRCYAGDVADAELVRTAVAEARLPIAGVMQMAMVLCDVGIMDMDAASWAAAIRPKIDGTWTLHHHLPAGLDFFVLFASMAGLFGYFGQANYSSANAFLDAFVQYRQALGLVASVIDLGPIDDVGFMARSPGSLANMLEHAAPVSEQDFLNALQLAVTPPPAHGRECQGSSYSNPRQVALIPACSSSIADPDKTTVWKRDARMAIYRSNERDSPPGNGIESSDPIRALMSSLTADPGRLDHPESAKALAQAIGARLSTFLVRDVEGLDLSQTLAAAGVDSLVAIELRNWWRQRFGVDVSVLELLNGGSIWQLGHLAIHQLKAKYCR